MWCCVFAGNISMVGLGISSSFVCGGLRLNMDLVYWVGKFGLQFKELK